MRGFFQLDLPSLSVFTCITEVPSISGPIYLLGMLADFVTELESV